jgi:hypothetical protein
MSLSKTHSHPIISRITFGAFALSLFTLGCDSADEPESDDELLTVDAEDEDDALAVVSADEDEIEDETTPAEELPLPDDHALDLDLAAALDPMAFAWTGSWFSEETPSSTCPNSQLVTAVACSGSYCDNMQIGCHGSYPLGAPTWTSWFSEEGTNWRTCSGSSYVSGMDCSGSFCDNISLECSPTGTTPASNTCAWSGYFSEESPPYFAPAGTAIKGVQCNGSNCDNKRYYVCPIS